MVKGSKMSPEAKQRISEGLKKNYAKHPELKKQIGDKVRGRKHSAESIQKMADARRGKYLSAETKKKISLAKSGEKNTNWKGGRVRSDEGYIFVFCPDHPAANARRQIYEHRLVMEDFLGRFLEPGEIVHHINGVKDDNRIANLLLVTDEEHKIIHMWNRRAA